MPYAVFLFIASDSSWRSHIWHVSSYTNPERKLRLSYLSMMASIRRSWAEVTGGGWCILLTPRSMSLPSVKSVQ
jgi:hypothetical protein